MKTLKKTFRTVKARQLTKKNIENGHSYIFSLDKDITADYNGIFYKEDENWMSGLTTNSGGNLLKWTNMPEGVKETLKVRPSNVVMLSDLPTIGKEDVMPEFTLGRSKGQIEAELELAKLLEQRELENRPVVEKMVSEMEELQQGYANLQEEFSKLTLENEVLLKKLGEEPVEEVVQAEYVEEVIVEDVAPVEEPEVVDSKDLAMFKDAYIKGTNMVKFIREMKLEFGVEDLTAMAKELGLEYTGKKAYMIELMASKIGE